VPSFLSGAIALAVCLPLVVLLGWLEARYGEDEGTIDARPRRSHPKRNTWTPEKIDA